MIRRFLRDQRGSYALMTAVAIVPIMGALALAVDYTEMSKQRQETLNALDAAGIATARRIVEGASDDDAKVYAKQFFEANLGSVEPANAELTIVLPQNNTGGGTLKLTAALTYKPFFFPTFAKLMHKANTNKEMDFTATAEVRLKNTLEVALVLDNSGSMAYIGTGSGKKRIELLKEASKQLVDTIAGQAALMKQVNKPVQFSLVPFSASVNVGPNNADAAWMDTNGLSPVHHETFDWTSLTDPNKKAQYIGGAWYKKGNGWGAEKDQVLSRFTLYQDMKQVSSREWVTTGQEYVCTRYRSNGTCREGRWQDTGYYDETVSSYASWQGCVEERPYPLNINDDAASTATPASLFVPMFAPDEPGDRWATEADSTPDNFNAANNWWNDGTESSSGLTRQKNMSKYFDVRPYGATSPQGSGPSYSCTTEPITPLTDVSVAAGKDGIKASIDKMAPTGNTNVPEGMAWGWRTLSSRAPFTEGRPETEKGNDKVVIVLTDGANTYSALSSDPASNKSSYAAYGYAGHWPTGYTSSRIFQGVSGAISKTNYSSDNYTAAMNEHFKTLCDNAKAAGLMVMTVSLDLKSTDNAEKAQIAALKACASDSRFRKDASGKPVKLYWNATGGSLSDTFKDIANELSNLRIVG